MIADFIVEHRRFLVTIVILVSAALAPLAARIETDRTLKTAYITSSDAYKGYQKFVRLFGDDEFVLIAIKSDRGVDDPAVLSASDTITRKLQEIPYLDKVISISNQKVFKERAGLFGDFLLIEKTRGRPELKDPRELERIKTALPVFNYLVSSDNKTLGIMVKIRKRWKFDPKMAEILRQIRNVVAANLPSTAEYRVVGAPILREAVQNNTLKTVAITLLGGAIIGALVAFYIFKSLKATLITFFVVNGAVVWAAGLMAVTGIPLNSTTALSFGLVLIVSVVNVIHIVTHYYTASGRIDNKEQAVREGLRVVWQPCLMCAVTTSVAFATIMVSPMPMVRQLGFVMSVGVMASFLLSCILTPACLMVAKPVDRRTREKMEGDWVAWLFRRTEDFVFRRYRFCLALGVIFAACVLAGTPLVRVDTQLLNLFVKSSEELAAIRFVEDNLTSVHLLELVVEGNERAFTKVSAWEKIRDLQQRLAAIPEVIEVDSGLPLFEYIHELVSESRTTAEPLLSRQKYLSQVFMLLNMNREARELLPRYLDTNRQRLHITVKIRNRPSETIGKTIEAVESAANDAVKGWGKILVTGELAVFATQVSDLVRSMFLSLILAFAAITILMIIQMRSWTLGLVSLFPNVFPALSVFGLMGWLGIPLDGVTIFAATIAIGLSVDDTIHYLTQLRLAMTTSRSGEVSLERPLREAYGRTAKALISTSATLFFGVLVICLTPTRPAIYFGFLGSTAIVIALVGDIVLLPALILSSQRAKKLVLREFAPPTSEQRGAYGGSRK